MTKCNNVRRIINNGEIKTLRKFEFIELDWEKYKSLAALPISEETIQSEETQCSFFGCAKPLSLMETLCGNRCLKHQGKQMDITNCISI